MRAETIACAVLTAVVAALYGTFPDMCQHLAGEVGAGILHLAGYTDTHADMAQGETALMMHSAAGNIGKVRSLLDAGATPNAQDQDGNTALMRAALSGHTHVVETLLAKGADPDKQTAQGGTALMHASFNGHTDVVRKLLEHRADLRLLDSYGTSALMRAADKGHAGVIRVILELVPPDAVREVIDRRHKYDVHTALSRAAVQGYVECVQMLLAAGASTQGQIVNEATRALGPSVLQMTRQAEQWDVLKVLHSHCSTGQC